MTEIAVSIFFFGLLLYMGLYDLAKAIRYKKVTINVKLPTIKITTEQHDGDERSQGGQ